MAKGGAELLQLPKKNNKRSVRNLLSTLLEEKQKKLTLVRKSAFCVVPPGIEPGTQGFSVLCSTN